MQWDMMIEMERKDNQSKQTFQEVVNLIEQILSENGCPLDKGLSLKDEANNLIEEANEVRQEILRKNINAEYLKEEIGDVLWDVIILSKIAEKRKLFSLDEMLELLKRKIKQRNPHVFGKEKANSLKEAIEAKRRAKREWKAKQ